MVSTYHYHVNLGRAELEGKYKNIERAIKEIDPSTDYTGNILKPNAKYNPLMITFIYL